jgi:pimeloyl-ACP methyl ester carboxylesterase
MAVEFLSVAEAHIAYQRQFGDSHKPSILFLGGYASDMEGAKACFLAQKCEQEGISFVRFDYRGCGQSTGSFRDGTIGAWLEDSVAIFNHLMTPPTIVIGSSMGGWLGLLLAQQKAKDFKAFIGVAAAPDFTETLVWEKLTSEQRGVLLKDGEIFDDAAPIDRRIPMTLSLIEEARHHLILKSSIKMSCPLRFLQGTKDEEVPPSYAQRVTQSVQSDDTRVTLIEEGDHRLSTPDNLNVLWQTVAEFL